MIAGGAISAAALVFFLLARAARRASPRRSRPVTPFQDLGPFLLVAAGVAGLLVGSFLNVLVHRLPRGESVVSPGSHCPRCGAPVTALQNVPVISWLALRGTCATCRAPIAIRYPAIELANGAALGARRAQGPRLGGDRVRRLSRVRVPRAPRDRRGVPDPSGQDHADGNRRRAGALVPVGLPFARRPRSSAPRSAREGSCSSPSSTSGSRGTRGWGSGT